MKTLVFFSLLFSGFCFGQSVTSQAFNDIQGNNRSWQDMQIGTVYDEVPIEGSPYMDELYKMGIASVNGKEINLLMRYDAYNDQIELIDRKNKAFNLLKKNNIEAEFEGKTFKVVEYVDNGQKKLVYANPLNVGKVILYFKPRKVFVQAEKPEHGYDSYDPPRFEASHFYLIQKKGETAEEIKFSKGRLLRFLRDKAPELRDYIAQQELKLNTQEDALKLINYYNSL
jgi:hypothetical protein